MPAKTFAVLSGKGGVGKTHLALNLALALQEYSVLVIDCDFGLANVDVLLGLNPEKTLQDVLSGQIAVEDVVLHTEYGIDILPAASGTGELAQVDIPSLTTCLQELDSLYDYIFFDLGAGIGETVRGIASITEERLLVTTPEPTALTDCYALIKVLSQEGLSSFSVIVNMIENEEEGKASFSRLHAACEHFLSLSPKFLGTVRFDPHLSQAVCQQEALLFSFPDSDAAYDIRKIATKV